MYRRQTKEKEDYLSRVWEDGIISCFFNVRLGRGSVTDQPPPITLHDLRLAGRYTYQNPQNSFNTASAYTLSSFYQSKSLTPKFHLQLSDLIKNKVTSPVLVFK